MDLTVFLKLQTSHEYAYKSNFKNFYEGCCADWN